MAKVSFAFFGALITCVSWAQPVSVDGHWQAEFQGNGGKTREASVTIQSDQGVWKTFLRGNEKKTNPCLGANAVVKIQSQSAETIVLQVTHDLAGCSDSVATLRVMSPSVLEGTFEDGRPVKLTRE